MNIRKAVIEDIDELYRLEAEYIKEQNLLEIPVFRCTCLDTKKIKNNFEKKIRKRNKLFLVIELNKKLKGYFFGEISINKMDIYGYNHKKEKIGYIENVFIEKKLRGKGALKEFTKQFIEYLKNKKIKYCELHVRENNKIAKQAYLKQGFNIIENKMRLKI